MTLSPLIVLGRGGGGTRLASALVADLGCFLGNDMNESGDSLEMVSPIYGGVIRRSLAEGHSPSSCTVHELHTAAAAMRARGPTNPLWGFKLPEAMLILPELMDAFPEARILHLLRDPLDTCLRRTHQTARMDNAIGCAALAAAYRHLGRPLDRIGGDHPAMHMACTTVHQIETVMPILSAMPSHRCLEVRFEQLIADPHRSLTRAAAWLGVQPVRTSLVNLVDRQRAQSMQAHFPAEVVAEVATIVKPLRQRLGYVPTDRAGARTPDLGSTGSVTTAIPS